MEFVAVVVVVEVHPYCKKQTWAFEEPKYYTCSRLFDSWAMVKRTMTCGCPERRAAYSVPIDPRPQRPQTTQHYLLSTLNWDWDLVAAAVLLLPLEAYLVGAPWPWRLAIVDLADFSLSFWAHVCLF